MTGGPCTGLQSRPPAFLALPSVPVDEWQRLVLSFAAVLQAQRALCCAFHHVRMHLNSAINSLIGINSSEHGRPSRGWKGEWRVGLGRPIRNPKAPEGVGWGIVVGAQESWAHQDED